MGLPPLKWVYDFFDNSDTDYTYVDMGTFTTTSSKYNKTKKNKRPEWLSILFGNSRIEDGKIIDRKEKLDVNLER